LSEAQVRRCLQVDACIAANRKALGSIRKDKITGAFVPTRIGLPYGPSSLSIVNGGSGVDGGGDNSNNNNSSSSSSSISSSSNSVTQDWSLFKPAAFYPLPSSSPSTTTTSKSNDDVLMGMKVISMRAQNASSGKSTCPATILLLNAKTGEITAVLGATYLTAARTAAGSAIATELILRETMKRTLESCVPRNLDDDDDEDDDDSGGCTGTIPTAAALQVVVFGAGLQAEMHVRSLRHVMKDIGTITIVNRSIERAENLKGRLESLSPSIPTGAEEDENKSNNKNEEPSSSVSSSPREDDAGNGSSGCSGTIQCLSLSDTNAVQTAVQTADVIVTATNSSQPLFRGEWVKGGCHINGIGSYTGVMEEVDHRFVRERCKVIIDTVEAFEVGDLQGITEGSDNYLGLLGDVMQSGSDSGSEERDMFVGKEGGLDCTFYKAVGTAVQDIFTAQTTLENAIIMEIGTKVDI